MGTSQVPGRAEVICMNTYYDPKDLARFPETDRGARELWEKPQVKLLNVNVHCYPTIADALGQPAEV